MATATQASNGSSTEKARGFGPLPCPRCGQDAVINLSLDDLQVFNCNECNEEFSREELETLITKWCQVFAWLDLAPARD